MTPAERRRIKAALDGLEARVRALAARVDAAEHDGPFVLEDAMVAGIDARNERQRARRQSVADLYASVRPDV